MRQGTDQNTSKNVFDIPQDVDYVITELVHKDLVKKRKENTKANIELERGLFIGFEVQDNIMFICTTTNGQDLLLYNADHYNITMLEYGDDLLKHVCVYTDTPSDQGEAINILGNLLERFQGKEKVLKDKNLIDISKIKNYGIDKTVFETASDENRGGNTMTGNRAPSSFTPDQYDEWEDYMCYGGPAPRGNNAACGYGNTSYVHTPKEPKAIFFKRKSTKPGKKKLNSMKAAVEEVIANKGHEIKTKPKAGDNESKDEKNEDENGEVLVGEVIKECDNSIPI